jgi:16S rRNA C967 or C1407 C5-methylase (RsmB/RsmF family)
MNEFKKAQFESRILRDYPVEGPDLLHALWNTTAPVSVRKNPAKWDSSTHQMPAQEESTVPWEPLASYLASRPVFTLDPLLHAGAYYVQEASSMWIGEVVRQLILEIRKHSDRPLKVLDLCAAPGGKSTHLASVLGSDDLLICNEVHRARARILQENVMKWGNANVAVTSSETQNIASLGSWFDLMVVDAPCSGEGLFRRDPAALQEWSDIAVDSCELRQWEILRDIWPALKPGGYLIYSTCTFNRIENDSGMTYLLATGEAESITIDTGDPSNGIIVDREHPAAGVIHRCFPGRVHGEGFTFSILRKKSDAPTHYATTRPRARFLHTNEENSPWAEALRAGENFDFFTDLKSIYAVPTRFSKEFRQLDAAGYTLSIGVELGDDRRPGHALALSHHLKRGFFPEIELALDQALNYLRKESLRVDAPVKGWVLLTWQGLPLGFGKAVKGRINNQYPTEWRIRNL